MPKHLIRAVLLTAGFTVGAPSARAQMTSDVALGIEALARHDVTGAMQAFERATHSPIASMRATGDQWRGHVAWMIRGDTAAARTFLDRALLTATDSTMVLIERGRMEAAGRRYREGIRVASGGLTNGIDGERRGIAARTVASIAFDAAWSDRRHAVDSIDRPRLAVARDSLLGRVAHFPGRTADALALLRAGIMLGDSVAIDAGWSSYYSLMDAPVATALDTNGSRIRMGGWQSVANGLARSGLYEEAALFLEMNGPTAARPSGGFADVITYATFLREMRASAHAYYRRALAGRAREGDLQRAVNSATREVWPALTWPSAPPPYYPAGVSRELAKRFGTIMSIEFGTAYEELHLAHIVASYDPARAARPATGRRIVVLDGPIDNGMDAWLLDGAGGRAGWVSGDSIFELRPSFTEAPFRAWLGLADPQSMPGEMFRISRDSTADIERARHDSLGFLPGVAARMFRAGAQPILDSLYSVEMPQRDRELAFVRILFRALTESSIALHEGRHVMDLRANPDRMSADAEFRAKVDEVSLASRPKLALTAILTPVIGDPSPHGQANRRVMVELTKWIRANGASIRDYDAGAPAVLQLPNLTDAQVMAAFASMRRGR